MNLMMGYFLLQLGGLYAMLLVLDYYKKPGSRYLEGSESTINLAAYKKAPVPKDKAA